MQSQDICVFLPVKVTDRQWAEVLLDGSVYMRSLFDFGAWNTTAKASGNAEKRNRGGSHWLLSKLPRMFILTRVLFVPALSSRKSVKYQHFTASNDYRQPPCVMLRYSYHKIILNGTETWYNLKGGYRKHGAHINTKNRQNIQGHIVPHNIRR